MAFRSGHALVLVVAACLFLARPATAEAPSVFVTIKPLHALVAAVMADVGTPGGWVFAATRNLVTRLPS